MKQTFLRGALAAVLLVITGCSQATPDFTLTLGGDIMLARNGEAIFKYPTGDINPWMDLEQQGVITNKDSAVPDYFFANLESPLGLYPSSNDDMNLCSDLVQIRVLVEGGVDLVSLANNHRIDCVLNDAETTKGFLDQEGIQSASMGFEPTYLDIPGGKMAVIASEDVTGSLDLQSLLASIKQAHEKAQVVVVSMHWGNEYQAGADERQQSLAQQIANAGADVIWGHHPHVLQKIEWLKSEDSRQVLVLYSLGNLLADQWMLEDAQQSALVRLSFVKSTICGIEIIPLEMNRASKSLQIVKDETKIGKTADRLGLDELESYYTPIKTLRWAKTLWIN